MHVIISLSNGQSHTINVGAVAVLLIAWVIVLVELAKMARAGRKAGCHGS